MGGLYFSLSFSGFSIFLKAMTVLLFCFRAFGHGKRKLSK